MYLVICISQHFKQHKIITAKLQNVGKLSNVLWLYCAKNGKLLIAIIIEDFYTSSGNGNCYGFFQ